MTEKRPKVAMFSAVNFRPGFQITFDNGYTASVQWGYGNYCGRRGDALHEPFRSKDDVEGFSIDAEIACRNPDGDFCNVKCWFPHDDVRGHCTPSEVLQFLNDVASMSD